MMMKDPSIRTKIVIRHLPPTLSQTSLFEQINYRFAGRYSWFSFRPGKKSVRDQKFARAYLSLNRPEDVFEFAEFFNGHVFVNEKGAQFKAIVEYSPSQRVPKQIIKKDGREGTILKDPEYLDFLECIAKPPENLPSADVQLERREAERAGIQEPVIVTPLMEFIRKKRAAKSGNQASSDGKSGGRVRIALQSRSRSTKLVSEKKKASGKNTSGKEKPTRILVHQRGDQSEASSGAKVFENQSGKLNHDAGKKKILLLRGKEKDISRVSDSLILNEISAPPVENANLSTGSKRNQRHDASGRIIRSLLLKDKSSSSAQPEQEVQILSSEKGKRPPRPVNVKSIASYPSTSDQSPGTSSSIVKRSGDEKSFGNDSHAVVTIRDKHERRTRKERHESGIWAPRRDASNSSNEHSQLHSESCDDPQRRYGRRSSHNKDENLASEGKLSKRGSASVHGLHEDVQKQVWVQKSASGS
ncbi:hypothetical protein V2J09_008433 [Rumex salicifolius]